MAAENPIPATVESYAARNLQKHVDRIAGRLERLARDVGRYADDIARVGKPGCASYGQITGDITHEIMTALMNLNLESLSTYATEADIARAKGE